MSGGKGGVGQEDGGRACEQGHVLSVKIESNGGRMTDEVEGL